MSAAAQPARVPLPRRRARTLKRIGVEPVRLINLFEQHLTELGDPTTKTWVPLIARPMAYLVRAFDIPPEEAVDWIYETEPPVNVFEFSAWVRSR